jgi:hypothetical protein
VVSLFLTFLSRVANRQFLHLANHGTSKSGLIPINHSP